ncbi:4-diphosphocytidyl-2-C-methyl-D-erythritol kinase [Microbacterium azadirachtae]|uniref:4-diphosphocytidyl-2-C-methyl-D-erythritol kinase n=1 Tax=Microbacterium azadirachtae TaxID=582680 RepID=A0A0F0KMB8_9MICO|nr:4-(cytidine 5'-diphospho)-2-C-methyl-D-erythritol kinase [Microbacterium azadirachtae]KJL21594.1 4-diphosphocytidyl-2-C-methyl-D-erythritol kinase [Microbacterium azadirachtae]
MSIAEERPGDEHVRRVHVRAPGKINLFLGVGDLDEDGYHELSTVFQAVSLYEDVIATPADDFTIAVSGVADPDAVPLDDRNLAMRAAKVLAAATGYDGGVHLDVRKSVPVAGGMGGGSADAAAALVACNELWRTGVDHGRLHELAARLGADVPFALMGGTAVGSGRGDVLTPALSRGRYEWVLVLDDEGLSTPSVYRAFDLVMAEDLQADPARHAQRRSADPVQVPPSFFEALLSGDPFALGQSLRNQLQAGSFRLRPQLEELIDRVRDSTAVVGGIVSGSGPTVAFLCESATGADAVAERLREQGRTALRAHGPVRGAHVVSTES